jgi:hypothetical protein
MIQEELNIAACGNRIKELERNIEGLKQKIEEYIIVIYSSIFCFILKFLLRAIF